MLSSRPYALPTDGDLDVSNYDYINARTPGKAPLKTPGRTLHKSRSALQENAGYDSNGGTTIKKKGKTGGSHTPFHPAIQARKEALQSARKPVVVVSRPLGDKTPAPNRHQMYQPMQTPAPQTIKMAKLSIIEAAEEDFMMPTPGAYLRPSSARRNSRAPRTSGGGQKMLFKTPTTNGRHWDVSDGELQLNIDEADADAEVEVDDYDEIEYMPPKVPEQPYEPPFDMPDYKSMGKSLMSLAGTAPIDKSLDIKYARPIDEEINVSESVAPQVAIWERPMLADLSDEEDPFNQFIAVPPTTSATSGKQRLLGLDSVRPGPSRPNKVPPARPLTRAATVSAPRVTSRDPSTVKPTVAPRTTSNTPAPSSTSTSTAKREAAAIKRPTTSTGIRAPVSRITGPKATAPSVGPSATKINPEDASKRTAAGPSSSIARPRSVAGRLTNMTSRVGTTTVATKPVAAPLALVSRTRSATAASSSRTTSARPQPKAAPAPTLARSNVLFTLDPVEPEDFVFEV